MQSRSIYTTYSREGIKVSCGRRGLGLGGSPKSFNTVSFGV